MARRPGILFLVLATALLTVTAYWLLFTTFMSHDDEGYVLVSLKNYSAHGGLYAQVYSQYGPFVYFLHDLGHRLLTYEFTNTNGRLITLLCWIGSSVACAHLVWRQTRAVTLTAFTLGLTFFHLWLMVGEPIHPGGLIAVLVALGAWWGAGRIERMKMNSLAIGAGLIGAALLLTKINVGLFFVAGAGAWFAIQLRHPRQAAPITTLVAVLLAVLPFGLMGGEIHEPWARLFATLASIASLTMIAATWKERQPLTDWKQAGWGAVAMASLGTVVILSVCLRGTSLAEMIQGVLLGPLRQPGVYHFPPDWKPGAAVAGGLSLGLAALMGKGRAPQLDWLLVALRLVLVAEFCLASLEVLPFTSHSSTMSYLVPLAWIFVRRLAPDDHDSRPNVAPWVGLLLVLQYLHAYPVAGSQIAWGTFLIVPVLALGLADTQRFLLQRKLSVASTVLAVASLALAVTVIGRLGLIGWHRYAESRPLQLNGAEDIRVPEEYASTLRVLSLNATVHGDMLFSLPGMFSFNGWTQLPTPTLNNTTHWFSLLDLTRQNEIADALRRGRRPVLIINQGLLEFLADGKFAVSSPLNDYLHENFSRVFTLGKYEFLIRHDRTIVPVSTAELLQLKTPQPGTAPNRLELVVVVPPGHHVTSIELATLEDHPRTLGRWDKTTGPLLSTALNPQGTALEAERGSAWGSPLPALVRLDLPLTTAPAAFVRRYTVVYLRDLDGSITAEARFTD